MGWAPICQKFRSEISKNFERSLTQSNEIWSLAETCLIYVFLKKYKPSNKGGGKQFSTSWLPITSTQISFHSPPTTSYFSPINIDKMCLIFESFMEFYYLRYQLVNKRTVILPLATSHIAIAHLCNQFNHVFALLISATFQNHYFLSK